MLFIFRAIQDTTNVMAYIKCLSIEAVLNVDTSCTPMALVDFIQSDYYHFGIINKDVNVTNCINGNKV